MAPSWKPVTTGVCCESILCLVPFDIFLNDLDDGQCTNSNCADDSKLGEVPETPEGRAAIQRDTGKLEKRANRNVMKFNKEKYEVLHLGRNNPLHQCMMGDILSKGLMTFAFYALNKHQVVKSVA